MRFQNPYKMLWIDILTLQKILLFLAQSHTFLISNMFSVVSTHTTEDAKERKFVRENYAIKILVIFVQLLFGQVRQKVLDQKQ